MDLLSVNSELWTKTKINQTLIQQNALGNTLKLYCKNHPETITEVRPPKEFDGITEGGCKLTCHASLKCGHKCSYHCHPRDQSHEGLYKCTFNCRRKICDRNHRCPLLCGDICKPCKKVVTHKLSCGHEVLAACNVSTDKIKCSEVINLDLLCGHEAKTECSKRDTAQ